MYNYNHLHANKLKNIKTTKYLIFSYISLTCNKWKDVNMDKINI